MIIRGHRKLLHLRWDQHLTGTQAAGDPANLVGDLKLNAVSSLTVAPLVYNYQGMTPYAASSTNSWPRALIPANHPLNLRTRGDLSYLVLFKTGGIGGYQVVVAAASAGGGYASSLGALLFDGSLLKFYRGNGNNNEYYVASSTALSNSTVYSIGIRTIGTRMEMHINGALNTVGTLPTPTGGLAMPADCPLDIGGMTAAPSFRFQGAVGEVIVFEGAIPPWVFKAYHDGLRYRGRYQPQRSLDLPVWASGVSSGGRGRRMFFFGGGYNA